MIRRSFKFLLCMLAFWVAACEKNPESSVPKQLLYADSIFYLKSGSADQLAYPLQKKAGKYSSFPFGLALDENTGAINVSKSETGLRYMVFFDGEDGRSDSGTIVISGINYPDHYYILAKGDSIALPVYNARRHSNIPGSSFDVSQQAAENSLAVTASSGAINLAASLRNGMFGAQPANNAKKDIPITYRLNDASDKALNTITVRFYYFTSMKEVPEYLRELLEEREMAFQPLMMGARSFTKNIKPRPPCVIIIPH